MIDLLCKPYHQEGTVKSKILSTLAFGLFIFLFLFIFKPFGLFQLEAPKQLWITLGFGLITSSVIFVFLFVIEPVVISRPLVLWKSILWDILITSCIGAANYFYGYVIFKAGFHFRYLLYSVWTAIIVGSIPVTLHYFFTYNRLYRNILRNAEVPEEKIKWGEELTITAGHPKNNLKFNPAQIQYLCSNDNYVTIVTYKDGMEKKCTIRGTLKSAESELRSNSRFIRCHKCYIVNIDFVQKISGNDQNMKIKILNSGEEIPVSRIKTGLVKSKIKRS